MTLPFVIGIEQIVVAALGVVAGLVFGAIPGMTATMAVAVFLPLTYAYDLETALYLLLGLYVGGISGGLIPAILINIPGTPSSITTTFDGYPMAKRGVPINRLRILNTLISQLVSMKQKPALSEEEATGLSEEQKDELIKSYQQQIKTAIAASSAQGQAAYGLAGLMPEAGAVVSVSA